MKLFAMRSFYLTFLLTGIFCLLMVSTAAQAQPLKYGDVISQYYESNAVNHLWTTSSGRPRQNAVTLIRFIENSWQHGFNPEHYHVSEIKNYLTSRGNGAPASFDRLLSDAYLRYTNDLTGMRVRPRNIGTDTRYWQDSPSPDALLSRVQSEPDFENFLNSLEPIGPLYGRLKQEVIDYVENKEKYNTRHRPMTISGSDDLLRPGESDPALVPALRDYFNVSDVPDDWNRNLYDDTLVQKVAEFQRQNHVQADGIIGPETLALLNKSPRDQYHQALANMERLRWLQRIKPQKYVMVNIPSQTLWTIQDDVVTHEMPVVVGRPERPTMSFVSDITGVRFNPTWTVPRTIKEEDFLPMLRDDPMSLAEKNIDIRRNDGDGWQSIDPASVDWASVTPSELGQYMMVQQPGPTNPLGTIRILMPNQYNIYLHDTTNPEYFNASIRTESSGCVRVKEPKTLADFILRPNRNWNENFVDEKLAENEMTDIRAAQSIPVYLLYLTVWMNDDGSLTYGPDIYNWDRNLLQLLKNSNSLVTIH